MNENITKNNVKSRIIRNDIMQFYVFQDAIKLIGQVNFPNLLVLTPKVDFQCIPNGSIESRTIKIQNVTPLQVCYRFNWKKCFIITKTVTIFNI